MHMTTEINWDLPLRTFTGFNVRLVHRLAGNREHPYVVVKILDDKEELWVSDKFGNCTNGDSIENHPEQETTYCLVKPDDVEYHNIKDACAARAAYPGQSAVMVIERRFGEIHSFTPYRA